MANKISSAIPGFSRIGPKRELKVIEEKYWQSKISLDEFISGVNKIRGIILGMQKNSNLDIIPCNDFTLYDHILDTSILFGVIPERYDSISDYYTKYFAMARGCQKDGIDVPAMEMTKWFDTNYHYIVPEFQEDQRFSLNTLKIDLEIAAAKKVHDNIRPVIVGPITFLMLGKMDEGTNQLTLLPQLLHRYKELLKHIKSQGIDSIQIDEPYLIHNLNNEIKNAYIQSYKELESANMDIMLTTYFGSVEHNKETLNELPVNGLHIDLTHGEHSIQFIESIGNSKKTLSLGVISGRNIWANNLNQSVTKIKEIANLVTANLIVSSSCSLLHCPVDLDNENYAADSLNAKIRPWLAFAKQKLHEIDTICKKLNGDNSVDDILSANKQIMDAKAHSTDIHNPAVKERVANITPSQFARKSTYPERAKLQKNVYNLPILPTTTIGSFPQTQEIRKQRALYRKNEISYGVYEEYIKKEIEYTIRQQEELKIDVLVHGEAERNDMVEYFGQKLEGFIFTQHGWVQSYGSRCVKPPIIFGDVQRKESMTVKWSVYAQSLTNLPVKGMLTGPVTMLQWSFVRDDQSRKDTCFQIACAIRDEVEDLEKNSIGMIQVDEPALKEGCPIRSDLHKNYYSWAIDAFRLSVGVAKDETQIHTHMCYAEFNDIIEEIALLDADVISIESSRSRLELLDSFINYNYPNEIGPGVYDIHSPRIPSVEEMESLLDKAVGLLDIQQLWVNPDCGLKTRNWEETKDALINMMQAVFNVRAKHTS